jgi:hypothetical protein
LPSISTSRSPRRTPWPRSQFATWLERRDSSAKDSFTSLPSCSTIHRAGWSLPSATTSNQSSAQLNSVSCGQSNSRYAVS